MHLSRTTFAYEEAISHLQKFGRNPLIEIYLVQYLLILFYSEVEDKIKEIVTARLSQIDDRKVASFVFNTNEGMLKRVKKAEINELLNKFDCGDGDVISRFLEGMNLQPYFDAVTNRHKVAHDQGSTITLDYFGQALPCAEAILDAVEKIIAHE